MHQNAIFSESAQKFGKIGKYLQFKLYRKQH